MIKELLQEGLYDELLSNKKKELLERNVFEKQLETVDPEEFSTYAAIYLERYLRITLDNIKQKNRIKKGLELCNSFIKQLAEINKSFDEEDFATKEILLSVLNQQNKTSRKLTNVIHPGIPLSQSALLVNSRDEYRIGFELKKEIQSANRVDFICSFIKWSGLRLLKEEIKQCINQGIQVRVITTVYMGASDKKAIDELQEMGAKVKVSYDTRRTRLHAKAWLFHRNTGYSTAYVGSSNLSASAQTDGLEWNVRISNIESPHLIQKFEASFESYWNSEEFKMYEGSENEKKVLSAALNQESTVTFNQTFFDIKPYPFQQEILEKLELERVVKDNCQNLVVAATGTGKTVVSAFDYKQFKSEFDGEPKLLFVAHRKEILKQSLQTFRQILKEASFGELYVDGFIPNEWNHVFASIQSLHSGEFNFEKDHFDVVIIDEFHHAEANTYQRLLDYVEPKYLLGLTATPERTDGKNVMDFFGGKASAELRVWDAIEKGLLSPFQYFGVHDNTDLSNVNWVRGKYDRAELENLYTSSDERMAFIEKELKDKVRDPFEMKALGFCVGVQHAQYMAQKFNEMGIPSIHLSGNSDRATRDSAISKLRKGEINAIFTVDLFNEGIDIPEVDTILFLRPTESSILFTQQLGRGLRLSDGKECLTVLDFIGYSNKKFSYSNKFSSLVNVHGRKLQRHLENGFPVLPTGCAVELDKVSQEIVLDNIKDSIASNRPQIVSLYNDVERPESLRQFFEKTELHLEDFYKNDLYFTQLKREAGLINSDQTDEEKAFGRSIIRSIHIDSISRLKWSIDFFSNSKPPAISNLEKQQLSYLKMWAANFGEEKEISQLKKLLFRFWKYPEVVNEYCSLMEYLLNEVTHRTKLWKNPHDVHLELHAKYSRDEIMAAFNDIRNGKLYLPREGVFFHKETKCNLLFVTLNKSEKDYSPSTMYRDYAISDTLFHWQTQSNTKPTTKKGIRHLEHKEKEITPLLFIRNQKKDERRETEPYFFVGPVELNRWEGSQPMDIVWKVEERLPADIYKATSINKN
jgi:superfamily II DNA or RNA helicase